MRNFSKKSLVLFLLLAAVATATGWFLVREARKTGESLDRVGFVPVQIPKKPVDDTDLVDTSKWKTYRNEEYGFELKIPHDWFCGGVALDPDSKQSTMCLAEEYREKYYDGKLGSDEQVVMSVMINIPDRKNSSCFYEEVANNGEKISQMGNNNSFLIERNKNYIIIHDYAQEWNIIFSLFTEDMLKTFFNNIHCIP